MQEGAGESKKTTRLNRYLSANRKETIPMKKSPDKFTSRESSPKQDKPKKKLPKKISTNLSSNPVLLEKSHTPLSIHQSHKVLESSNKSKKKQIQSYQSSVSRFHIDLVCSKPEPEKIA